MKVLLAGANGQVGTEIANRGSSYGFQMISLGKDDFDITDFKSVENAVSKNAPDIIINAAAYTAVDNAETETDIAYNINKTGSENLANICSVNKTPLLHISTDYVFDGENSSPYKEDDKTNPQSVYGASKLDGDSLISSILQEHIILRVAWVFGSHGNNFVHTMLRLGGEHPELRIVADQFGGPTWAGDIASTLLTIAKQHQDGKKVEWGTYHYTGTSNVSWYDFACAIFSKAVELGILEKSPKLHPIPSEEYPTPAKRPKNSTLDCTKIKKKLEIDQPDWQIGLTETLENWKKK